MQYKMYVCGGFISFVQLQYTYGVLVFVHVELLPQYLSSAVIANVMRLHRMRYMHDSRPRPQYDVPGVI